MIDAVPVQDEVVVEYEAPVPEPMPFVSSIVNTSTSTVQYVIEWAPPIEVTFNNTNSGTMAYNLSVAEDDEEEDDEDEPVFLPHYGGYRDAAVLASSSTGGGGTRTFAWLRKFWQSLRRQRSIRSEAI